MRIARGIRVRRDAARLAAALAVVCAVVTLAADEGWVIQRLDIQYALQANGSVVARESIDVDFRGLEKHGIFRDLRRLMDFDQARNREYVIRLDGVTDAGERKIETKETDEGANRRYRIGDPKRTISGTQTYRLSYAIEGALNAFDNHDEFYWNATGVWPVTMARATVTVRAPRGSITKASCFEGRAGTKETCTASVDATGELATFASTRPLDEDEQMTIVAFLRKGAVTVPPPILIAKPRTFVQFFDTTLSLLAMAGTSAVVLLGGLVTMWWRFGRDRRFVSMHYLTQGTQEERVPLFRGDQVVVEFEPPEKLRPGQIGLLLDERADTLDVTATIIDLASRGYLSIEELPAKGWFGKTDWRLSARKPPDRELGAGELLEYEAIVLRGLFRSGQTPKLSDLKNAFYQDLAKAQAALYQDAVKRKWFPRNPNNVRALAIGGGILLIIAGVFVTIGLGLMFGAGLSGLAVIVAGILLLVFSGAMPRRTALGREMTRRSLGFMRYIKTGEVQQQAFAERAMIFTAYLPYAIVFKCVDKWARAFKDVDLTQATAGWYSSSAPFNAAAFSSSVSSFSSSVSSAIASTPGGSGSSGSSGSSGGGGGGGGGGSW